MNKTLICEKCGCNINDGEENERADWKILCENCTKEYDEESYYSTGEYLNRDYYDNIARIK